MHSVTALVKYHLSKYIKHKSTVKQKRYIRRHQQRINLLEFHPTNTHQYIVGNNSTMSKAFAAELDHKIQQVREYELIAHGYHNENIQYPVHVRRSHDGEKPSRTTSTLSKSHCDHRKIPVSNSTILFPSLHENLTKSKQNSILTKHVFYDVNHIAPPNKTINDIDPSLNSDGLYKNRKSSKPISKIYCSSRPHSMTSISLSANNNQHMNSFSNSSQTLINQSLPAKTLKQRFFSKFFNVSSKS